MKYVSKTRVKIEACSNLLGGNMKKKKICVVL